MMDNTKDRAGGQEFQGWGEDPFPAFHEDGPMKVMTEIERKLAKTEKQMTFVPTEWPQSIFSMDDMVPFIICRSKIFSTVRDNARAFFDDKEMVCDKEWRVLFSGRQLNQDDLDVWMVLLNLASKKPLGTPVLTSRRSILKMLEKDFGSKSMDAMLESIYRLCKCTLTFCGTMKNALIFHPVNNFGFEGNCNLNGLKEMDTVISFTIDPFWGKLIQARASKIPLEIVRDVRSNKLARWLLRYIATQGESFSVNVETIRQMSGNAEETEITDANNVVVNKREAIPLFKFRQLLINACSLIMEKAPKSFVSSLLVISPKEDGGGESGKLVITRPAECLKGVFVASIPPSPELLALKNDAKKTLPPRTQRGKVAL